jgi:hypothetical protein
MTFRFSEIRPGAWPVVGLLGIVGMLVGAPAPTQAGLTLYYLYADTQWGFSNDYNYRPNNYYGHAGFTNSVGSGSVTTSMPLFSQGGNDSAANFAATVSGTLSNVTANSFDFSFSGSAASDSFNGGSNFLEAFAYGEVEVGFTTDVPITVNLNLMAQPTMAFRYLAGDIQASTGAGITIEGGPLGGPLAIQAGLSAGQSLDTTAGEVPGGLPTNTTVESQTESYVYYPGNPNADSVVDGATSTSVQLGPGAYILIGNVAVLTDFNPSNGNPNTYAEGQFIDPSTMAQGSSGAAPASPAAAPEPSSFALFGMASVIFGGFRGWRRRTKASAALGY